MLGTILMVLGLIVLGTAVVLGGILGAAWYLAREVNAGHEPSCTCPACQGKRQRAWQARHGHDSGVVPLTNEPRPAGTWQKDTKPPPERSVWISTLELEPGMKVLGKETGSVYRVDAVTPARFGYTVDLTNILSGRQSHIPVQADKLQHRIWLIRRPKGNTQ